MQQTSIQLKTALLGLVFLASTMLKTGHLLLLHHDHHETPVCEIGHNDSGTHLHDERYNPDDCSICAFLFAVPELVSVHVSLKKQEMPSRGLAFASGTLATSPALHAIRLRGPPAQF